MNLRAVVAVTDLSWFEHFRPSEEMQRIGELNFWRPQSQQRFSVLRAGEPFFFRLKHPNNTIAGYGYFVRQEFLDVADAWDRFGTNNGASSARELALRISNATSPKREISEVMRQQLNCLLLSDVTFLPKSKWLDWRQEEQWAPSIVAFKSYDMTLYPGTKLASLLAAT